ncbi:MAG: DoxX family protein [Capsulimonas sp.]|jgi:uncharacterized membrane protein YphA (DoxX/SURF4 family)|nr:DoxX family protein [Capsulimonas sp.]
MDGKESVEMLKEKRTNNKELTVTVLRIILGAIFLISASVKVSDQDAFYNTIVQYHVVTTATAGYLASVIPWFELLCSLLLLSNVLVAPAVFLIIFTLCVFTDAHVLTLMRHMSIDCGCGIIPNHTEKVSLATIVRDIVLIAVGLYVLCGVQAQGRPSYKLRWKAPIAILILLLAGCYGALWFMQEAANTFPKFAKNYSDLAQNRETRSEKPRVLLFVKDGCDVCENELNGPIKSPSIAKSLRSTDFYIIRKSELDHDGLPIADKYSITFYPSFLFFDAAGSIKSELVGFHEAADINKSIEDVQKSSAEQPYARAR